MSDAVTLGHNNPPAPTLPERLAEASAELVRQLQELAELANGAPKEIATDQQALDVAKIASDAGTLRKRLDALRTAEKKPFLDATREVDNHFREPIERASKIDTVLMQRVTAYNRAKAAKEREAREAQERAAREAADAAKRDAGRAAEDGRTDDALASLQEASQAEDQAVAAREETPTAAEATRISGDGLTVSTRTEWTAEVTDFAKVDLDAIRLFIKPDVIEAACKAFAKTTKGTRQIAGVRIFEDMKATRRR